MSTKQRKKHTQLNRPPSKCMKMPTFFNNKNTQLSRNRPQNFNLIMGIYEKPLSSIILCGERLDASLLSSGIRQGFLRLQFLFNIIWEVLTTETGQENDIKCIQIRKEVKLSLFINDKILYINNPEESTKITPEQ